MLDSGKSGAEEPHRIGFHGTLCSEQDREGVTHEAQGQGKPMDKSIKQSGAREIQWLESKLKH